MPRAPQGDIEKPSTEPFFATFEIPPPRRKGRVKNAHRLALEKLAVGGDAYVIPIGGGDAKQIAQRMHVMATYIGKRDGKRYTARRTTFGGEPVVAVWRIS